MKPDKLTVHDVFQRERRYVVPLYQRSYVWKREEQWEPLWEDIEHQAEECLKAGDQVVRHSHFLGAIVLNVAKIVGSSVARSEIIDGQQRLTTLQVFLAALRDYAVESGSAHASRLYRLTTNEDEKPGSEGSFKVWPTNSDRELFKTVLTAKSPSALLKALDLKTTADAPPLAGAYFYFAEGIREFVNHDSDGDASSREQRLFGLLQALRTALQFVVIELEDSDDPQVIFETLNARGQPLLPSDLIRNFIFLQAANNRNIEAEALYNQFWRPFDEERQSETIDGENRFWHVKERQGRFTRPRIDLFIYHYLVMNTERELNIGQLFREFRDWRDKRDQPLEAFLADLKARGKLFAKLIVPTGTDKASTFAKRLKALDNSTVYPLLLHLLSLPDESLSLSERDQILNDLESWLVRRLVCQSTNKNYNRFFVSLLSKVKAAAKGEETLAGVIRGELVRSTEPTLNWPDDDEFRAGWLSKAIYLKSRPDRSVLILRAIEEKIHSSKNEAISLPDKLSVEHLRPQKGTLSDYPFAMSMPLQTGETPDRCRNRMINTLGNLTLLTQELNSSISNGPISEKSKAIAVDSDLRLNAWLRATPITTWSETSIVTRGEELFKVACQIWPHPS